MQIASSILLGFVKTLIMYKTDDNQKEMLDRLETVLHLALEKVSSYLMYGRCTPGVELGPYRQTHNLPVQQSA